MREAERGKVAAGTSLFHKRMPGCIDVQLMTTRWERDLPNSAQYASTDILSTLKVLGNSTNAIFRLGTCRLNISITSIGAERGGVVLPGGPGPTTTTVHLTEALSRWSLSKTHNTRKLLSDDLSRSQSFKAVCRWQFPEEGWSLDCQSGGRLPAMTSHVRKHPQAWTMKL